MIKHTSGPWSTRPSAVYGSAKLVVISDENDSIALCGEAEDARRIVACVNALKHLSTESLELGETQNMVSRAVFAEEQRDELLAALKEARSYVIELCGSLHIPLPEASMERFNAAIAKAEL